MAEIQIAICPTGGDTDEALSLTITEDVINVG
jgi:hypothetical protein